MPSSFPPVLKTSPPLSILWGEKVDSFACEKEETFEKKKKSNVLLAQGSLHSFPNQAQHLVLNVLNNNIRECGIKV